VRHLAHRAIERSIVNQVAVLLDVVDEHEVMREIGPAPGRHERRPRHAQEHRDQDDHDDRPHGEISEWRTGGAPPRGCRRQCLLTGEPAGRYEQRDGERGPRLDTETKPVDRVTGHGGHRQPGRDRCGDRFGDREARAQNATILAVRLFFRPRFRDGHHYAETSQHRDADTNPLRAQPGQVGAISETGDQNHEADDENR
jgi:hypothetical protein